MGPLVPRKKSGPTSEIGPLSCSPGNAYPAPFTVLTMAAATL